MLKRHGVYLGAIQLLPHTGPTPRDWKLDEAIRWAEAVWKRTGCDEPARVKGQRKTQDHYAGIPEASKDDFDRCWVAYRHKVGKQRAAARWAEIAPDHDLAARIIQAAAADAASPRAQGQVRKHLEGWLSERRWEDYAPTQQSRQEADDQARRDKAQALAHAKKMAARTGDKVWVDMVAKLTGQQ